MVFVLFGMILSVFGVVLLRGSEDTWICQKGTWVKHGNPTASKPTVPCGKKKAVMRLSSPAFADNSDMPEAYTCDGEGMSPPLAIRDVPSGATSLALVMDDPDAPSGTYHHLVVWNINVQTREISEGVMPRGVVVGNNSAGVAGYAGPCPPFGIHRYVFTLYALDTTVSLSKGATRTELNRSMKNHIIAETSLTGNYSRK